MPHVHHMDRRKRLLGDPLGQTSQMQGPIGMQLHPAIQGWGRAAQHQTPPCGADPIKGQIPGVVTGHRRILLVGTVVFLIEHDQPKWKQRDEHR